VSALGGCSEKVDNGEVEDFIRENAQAPALIESVDCPDDVEIDEGDTFECDVRTKGGGFEKVTMRQGEDGDVELAGTRQVQLPDGRDTEIIPENVEALIRGQAPEPERIVSVDCPAGIKLSAGARFDCVVRLDDGTKTKVPIFQRDALGNVQISR
jgi:hypothetical protein